MVFKVVCVLMLLAMATDAVTFYSHAFSSQHIHRHDGPHQKVYIVEHKHETPKKEVHKHEAPKKEVHKQEGHKKEDHKHLKHVDYYAHPKYEYGYNVDDHHTGDRKSHHEHRDGDSVKGYYEVHGPHGTARHVEYHADKHSGFHADVKHNTHHIVPKKHHHKD